MKNKKIIYPWDQDPQCQMCGKPGVEKRSVPIRLGRYVYHLCDEHKIFPFVKKRIENQILRDYGEPLAPNVTQK